MSNRSLTLDDVANAIAAITATTGRAPSVLHLARRLGMANTTFRRTYPEVVTQLQRQRTLVVTQLQRQRTQTSLTETTGVKPALDEATSDNARLRRRNRELQAQLDMACAMIQQLTITNLHIQHELEKTLGVVQLRSPHVPRNG